jgi:hypothetical protein
MGLFNGLGDVFGKTIEVMSLGAIDDPFGAESQKEAAAKSAKLQLGAGQEALEGLESRLSRFAQAGERAAYALGADAVSGLDDLPVYQPTGTNLLSYKPSSAPSTFQAFAPSATAYQPSRAPSTFQAFAPSATAYQPTQTQLTPLQTQETASVSAQDVLSDPFFKALAEEQARGTIAQRAGLGLGGSGGTSDLLTRNLLQLGEGFRRGREQDIRAQQAQEATLQAQQFGQGLTLEQQAQAQQAQQFGQATALDQLRAGLQAQQFGQETAEQELARAGQAQQFGQATALDQLRAGLQAQQFGQETAAQELARAGQAQAFGQGLSLEQLQAGQQQQQFNQALAAQQARFNQLFGTAQLGQQAATTLGTGAANLLTGMGAVQGAVPIAQAQANQQVTGDLLALGGTALGAMFGG